MKRWLAALLLVLGFCVVVSGQTPLQVHSYVNPDTHKIYFSDLLMGDPEKAEPGGGGGGQVVIITKEVVGDYQCIPAPGNPPTGNDRLYCDANTGLLTCITSTGVNCFTGGGGGVGTVTNVSFPTTPGWLTSSVTNPTTTPSISVLAAIGQSPGQVIGTCGGATVFSPCTLTTTDLPATSIFNGGVWNSSTTYATNTVVQFNGSSYISLVSNTSVTPGTDSNTWQVLAAAGANGLNGVNGVNGTNGYTANQILSGCGIEWTGNYNFTIGACNYYISGTNYTSALTNITLATADPTNNRIDTIGVDNTGSVFVLTGTPSANPTPPSVDPTTQLALNFVLVVAASSSPTNLTLVDIYLEGVEWTGSTNSNAHINLTSTNNPYQGTKDVEWTGATVNNYAQWVDPAAATVNLANYNALVFYIRSKAAWPSSRSVTIQWYNGGTAKGTPVVLKDGVFNFNSSNTTSYQQVSIPTSLFGINGVNLTTVRFTVTGPSGSQSLGFYLDEITLQGGLQNTNLPSNIMVYRGTYNASVGYNQNDVVTDGSNNTYIALATNTGQALSNTTYWQPLALYAGGTVQTCSQYGTAYFGTTTSITCAASPTANGLYQLIQNVTASAAVPPTPSLVGLSGRTISGASTTDTVLYSDNATVINHDVGCSQNVGQTLPTATTLGNAAFVYTYSNHCAGHTDTITPTTWTIQAGSAAAGSSLSVAAGVSCRIKVDPNSATNWLADCNNAGGGLSGMTSGQVAIAGSATTVTSSKALQGTDTSILTSGTVSGTGVSLCTDANGGATTSGCPAGGGYATLENAGTSITQRTTLNFIGAGSANINCVDNSGATRSDCTVTGINGPPSPTVNFISATSYTIQNSDNSWRDVFTSNSAVAVTLPQANTIASSPFVAARIQTNFSACNTTCTTSGFSQSSGHALIVAIGLHDTSNTVTTVTDSAGDTFTRIAPDVAAAPNFGFSTALSYWQATNIAASGSNTVSVTVSANSAIVVLVAEYIFAAGLDKGSSVSIAAGGSNSTTNAVSYVSEVALAANTTGTCNSGWTSRAVSSYGASSLQICEKLLNSVATVTYSDTSPNAFANLGIELGNYQISGSPVFTAGWFVVVENTGTNLVTVTPTTSTINGRTTLVLAPNEACEIMSDGTNYDAECEFIPNRQTNGAIGGLIEIASRISNNISADIGSTTLITTGATDASYTVEASLTCRTAVAGQPTLTIGWTDTSNTAQTTTVTPDCTSLGANSSGGISRSFRAKASTNITVATSHANSQPTYDVDVSIFQRHTQ